MKAVKRKKSNILKITFKHDICYRKYILSQCFKIKIIFGDFYIFFFLFYSFFFNHIVCTQLS